MFRTHSVRTFSAYSILDDGRMAVYSFAVPSRFGAALLTLLSFVSICSFEGTAKCAGCALSQTSFSTMLGCCDTPANATMEMCACMILYCGYEFSVSDTVSAFIFYRIRAHIMNKCKYASFVVHIYTTFHCLIRKFCRCFEILSSQRNFDRHTNTVVNFRQYNHANK